jgi:transcriptional regulator with XRE-family HTH domain
MTTFTGSTADTVIELEGTRKATAITRNVSNICVGRRLRVGRTSSGMSERELCDKLGIDRDDLMAYEQGAKRVNASLLLRIAELLDVRPDYFFQGYTEHQLSACLESDLKISFSLRH